jgi:hypothetical protein
MKAVLALVLILLLILIALPMAMGKGEMADCPMCTSPENHVVLGICAAILSLLGLVVFLTSTRFRLVEHRSRALLLARALYRPPRPV